MFLHCSRVQVDHIFVINTPQTHILVWNSDDVHFESLGINSPGDAPNTDGIHIHASTHVSILNAVIKSGIILTLPLSTITACVKTTSSSNYDINTTYVSHLLLIVIVIT